MKYTIKIAVQSISRSSVASSSSWRRRVKIWRIWKKFFEVEEQTANLKGKHGTTETKPAMGPVHLLLNPQPSHDLCVFPKVQDQLKMPVLALPDSRSWGNPRDSFHPCLTDPSIGLQVGVQEKAENCSLDLITPWFVTQLQHNCPTKDSLNSSSPFIQYHVRLHHLPPSEGWLDGTPIRLSAFLAVKISCIPQLSVPQFTGFFNVRVARACGGLGLVFFWSIVKNVFILNYFTNSHFLVNIYKSTAWFPRFCETEFIRWSVLLGREPLSFVDKTSCFVHFRSIMYILQKHCKIKSCHKLLSLIRKLSY